MRLAFGVDDYHPPHPPWVSDRDKSALRLCHGINASTAKIYWSRDNGLSLCEELTVDLAIVCQGSISEQQWPAVSLSIALQSNWVRAGAHFTPLSFSLPPKANKAFKERGQVYTEVILFHMKILPTPDQVYIFFECWKWFRAVILAMTLAWSMWLGPQKAVFQALSRDSC